MRRKRRTRLSYSQNSVLKYALKWGVIYSDVSDVVGAEMGQIQPHWVIDTLMEGGTGPGSHPAMLKYFRRGYGLTEAGRKYAHSLRWKDCLDIKFCPDCKRPLVRDLPYHEYETYHCNHCQEFWQWHPENEAFAGRVPRAS